MEVVELVFEPRTVLSSCCSTRHTPASCSGGSLSDCNGLFPGPCVLQLSPVARAECTSALSLPLSNPSETLGDLNRTTQSRGLCGKDSLPFLNLMSCEDLSSVLLTPHSPWDLPGLFHVYIWEGTQGWICHFLSTMLRASDSGVSPKSFSKPVREVVGDTFHGQ